MPFFLLLDSFWSVEAGVVVPSALVVEASALAGGAAAAAVLSMGVSGVTTPVPAVLVESDELGELESVVGVVSVLAALPSLEVEVTSSALPLEPLPVAGAGSPGRTFSTTALLPVPELIARLAFFDPPLSKSPPESVSLSGSMFGVPLCAAMWTSGAECSIPNER